MRSMATICEVFLSILAFQSILFKDRPNVNLGQPLGIFERTQHESIFRGNLSHSILNTWPAHRSWFLHRYVSIKYREFHKQVWHFYILLPRLESIDSGRYTNAFGGVSDVSGTTTVLTYTNTLIQIGELEEQWKHKLCPLRRHIRSLCQIQYFSMLQKHCLSSLFLMPLRPSCLFRRIRW